MPHGETRGHAKRTAGVLDAGVVLARLDRRRQGHDQVVRLFASAARQRLDLHLSIVTLAELMCHAAPYMTAVGLDPLLLLRSFNIALHSPDHETARQAATCVAAGDLSLAESFAAATAAQMGARLYTTDADLATVCDRLGLRVTLV
jgi:predicted nucleic acid-binding protein